MTQYKILKLAYTTALANWSKELDYLKEHPDNPFTQAKERKAYRELEEIRNLLIKEEQKVSEAERYGF